MKSTKEQIQVFHKRLLEAMADKGMSQVDLVNATGIPKGSISQYAIGRNMPYSPRLALLAKALNVNPVWLMGENVPKDPDGLAGIELPPKMVRVPILGAIACGKPITSEENYTGFADVPEHIKCDFCLRCKGDSMIGCGPLLSSLFTRRKNWAA